MSWLLAALLIAIALIVWGPFGGDGGVVKSGAAEAAEVVVGAGAGAPSDVAADVDLASAEARRAVEAGHVQEPQAPGDARAPADAFVVRVVVDGEDWLPKNWLGSVRWTDAIGVIERDVANGRIALPREPAALAEFEGLTAAGLAVRLVDFKALEASPTDANAPRFELRGELERGATLVWAASVADADRGPVELVFGGMTSPASLRSEAGTRVRNQRASQALLERGGITLPFELPRVSESTSLWVGHANAEWRSFVVEPSSTWIEVALVQGAAIRVLHDGQVGATVIASDRSAVSRASAPIVDATAVEISGLSAATHRVWIEDSRGDHLSREAHVALVAGATIEVDLRAEALLDGRGGVRIEVREVPRTLSNMTRETTVVLFRLAPDGSREIRLFSPKLVDRSDDGVTFETLGLEPGRYEVFAESHGAHAEFDVVAGEVVEVELDARCLGFVDFVPPPETVGGLFMLQVTRLDSNDGLEYTVFIQPADASEDEIAVPLVCGTYRASASDFGSAGSPGAGEGHALTSATFVVTSGEATIVALQARKQPRVELAVIDAATGEPLSFDVAFWIGIRATDVDTNTDVRGLVSFVGTEGAFTGAVWTLRPLDGPVRVEPPENAFWTFEALEPLDLSATPTITLRATAK